MTNAMGRSKAPPSLRRSAGARLITVVPCSSGQPELCNADRTRSRLSLTAASGSPTIDTADGEFGAFPVGMNFDFDRKGVDSDHRGRVSFRQHERPLSFVPELYVTNTGQSGPD